jgi:hypothetical protein
MRHLKLFVEAKNFDFVPIDVLIESSNDPVNGKNYYIEGPFVQTEIKNRNGRNYPKSLMVKCVENYIKDRMNPQQGFRSFGELGHPEGVEINLDKVCQYVQSLTWQGNDVIGKAKILKSHPCGRIVETFLEEKLRLGVSTRGLGALSDSQNSDGSRMVEAYEMIAVDVVADPSAPRGFVDGILENKEYIIQGNGIIVEAYNNLQTEISSLPKNSDAKNKVFINALEKFLKEI